MMNGANTNKQLLNQHNFVEFGLLNNKDKFEYKAIKIH